MWVTRRPPVSMCLRTCASVLVFILLFLYTVRISHRFKLSSLCPHSPIVPPASDLTYCLVLGCTTVVFNRVSLSLHWLLLSLATSDIYSVNTGVTRDLLPIQQRLYRMFII
jgi:hypothetical protein